ncbi:hypothetical protein D6T76_02205 [Enterobacter hormaechei]|nr:hypothetical protein [Salmonella enterica]QJQ14396.1 hypothetical protein D6T76_02205 [Enterobacter hormaechei]
MSLQVSHYNMLRASHEVSQKVVVRTVITVRFVPEADFLKYCVPNNWAQVTSSTLRIIENT